MGGGKGNSGGPRATKRGEKGQITGQDGIVSNRTEKPTRFLLETKMRGKATEKAAKKGTGGGRVVSYW